MTIKQHNREHQNPAQPSTLAIVSASAAAGLVFGVSGFLVVASTFGWSEAPPVTDGAQSAVASAMAGDAGDGDAARDPSCDRQAWPYVTPECRESKISGESRKVRVITRDANAPPTFIASPAPIVTPQQRKTARTESATIPQQAQPTATQPAPVQSASAPPHTVQPDAVQPDAVQPQTAQPVVAPAPERQQQAAAQPAVDTKAEAAYAQASRAEQRRAERRARAAERKAREAADRGKVVVRTIEFADGRKVTITREVGRGGMRQAVAELDRASQRAMERETVEERRARPQYYSVQSDDFADEE